MTLLEWTAGREQLAIAAQKPIICASASALLFIYWVVLRDRSIQTVATTGLIRATDPERLVTRFSRAAFR